MRFLLTSSEPLFSFRLFLVRLTFALLLCLLFLTLSCSTSLSEADSEDDEGLEEESESSECVTFFLFFLKHIFGQLCGKHPTVNNSDICIRSACSIRFQIFNLFNYFKPRDNQSKDNMNPIQVWSRLCSYEKLGTIGMFPSICH